MFGPEEQWFRRILREELQPVFHLLRIIMTGQTDENDAINELTAQVTANGARIGDLLTQLQTAHDADDDAAFEAAATAIRAQVALLAGQDAPPAATPFVVTPQVEPPVDTTPPADTAPAADVVGS